MTINSYLCNYISTHPNTWQQDIEALGVNIKINNDNQAIFVYNALTCDFTNPLVQESRGIIIDLDSNEVICWPYRKFGNSTEEYVDKINYKNALVEEKIDGSICKLWWNAKKNRWQWSTNGMIDANDANISDNSMTFYQLITKADNYSLIHTDRLSPNFTYIFELVSPYNQIVIHYDSTKLYQTGQRSNLIGQEFQPQIEKIARPKKYSLASYEDCIKAAEALNAGKDEVANEGFVVVDPVVSNTDGSFNRVKIKSPEYVALHHAINNGSITKRRAIDLIRTNSAKDIPHSPKTDAILSWYTYQYNELVYEVSQYIDYVRGLYAELNNDRKAVAKTINKDKFASLGFKALGNTEVNAQELLSQATRSFLEANIDEYEIKDYRRTQ